MIIVTSDHGRIGPIWWVNADQQPRSEFVPVMLGPIETDLVVKSNVVRWGTCGYGQKIKVALEQLDD